MRIDAYNQVASMFKSTKSAKVKNTTEVVSFKDQLELSRAGKDYQFAKQAVASASDIREDRVAELRTSIESGKYDVDTGDFASKLMASYQAAHAS